MKKKLQLKKIIALTFTVCLLTACGGSDNSSNLESYIAGVKANLAAKEQGKPKAAIQSPQPATFKPERDRDPFGMIASANPTAVNAAHPLSAFPLNMLRFVGTIAENNKMWAVIATPDNVLHRATVGDSISLQNSKIIKIEKDRLQVLETGVDEKNHKIQKIHTLQLKG